MNKVILFSKKKSGFNLVVNGSFDTNLNSWGNQNTYWLWSNSKAYHPNGSDPNLLYQDIIMTEGKTYKISFDLIVISGNIVSNIFGSNKYLSASNTYSYIIIADASNRRISFKRDSAFEGTIDNISIKEVL